MLPKPSRRLPGRSEQRRRRRSRARVQISVFRSEEVADHAADLTRKIGPAGFLQI